MEDKKSEDGTRRRRGEERKKWVNYGDYFTEERKAWDYLLMRVFVVMDDAIY